MTDPRAKPQRPKIRFPRIETGPPEPPSNAAPRRWIHWAASLAMHLTALSILALSFYSIRPPADPSFDATLIAGDPDGNAMGWSTRMGGIEEPAPMLEAGKLTADDGPVLTVNPFRNLVADPRAKPAGEPSSAAGAGSGGGRGGDGFGEARFGPGTEKIRGVTLKTGDPQFTLIWDSQVDLDLHVFEPGGAQLFWKVKGKPTDRGGLLDVDNVQGFGPENVLWTHGQGPPGEYRWYVEYYGGFGGYDLPTKWQVRIKQNGTEQVVEGRLRKIGEKSRTYSLRFTPGSRGPTSVD